MLIYGPLLLNLNLIKNTVLCYLMTFLIIWGLFLYTQNHKYLMCITNFKPTFKHNFTKPLSPCNAIMIENLTTLRSTNSLLKPVLSSVSLTYTHLLKTKKMNVLYTLSTTWYEPISFMHRCLFIFGTMLYLSPHIYSISYPLPPFTIKHPPRFYT